MATILVIDDDKAFRRTLELTFTDQGHRVITAKNAGEGTDSWKSVKPDIILLDLMLPDGNGIDMLKNASAEGLHGAVIMITGHQDLDLAIEAMRNGAHDYIHKPLNIDELEIAVDHAIEHINERKKLALVADLASNRSGEKLVGNSRAMIEIHKKIGLASRGNANVLITGESGTGKELVARAIHRYTSPGEPFIPVNCSALVPTLLESELFGHEKGAFTGADKSKPGRFELAGKGTLFLDEIGDLDLALQVKLLRVMQERNFERVGGMKQINFDARIISATHRNLEVMIHDRQFRDDLYYRLKVVEIDIPPLRTRIEDIEALTEHLLIRINRNLRRSVSQVPEDIIEKLKKYNWPGNVRELENRLTAGVMSSPGDTLQIELPQKIRTEPQIDQNTGLEVSWHRSLAEIEKEHIEIVLRKCSNRLGKACSVLGISRPTLRRKMEEYGLKKN
ncbi:MAG: sigma-54 dependent transcriptional regulator [Candidatus Electryonea clarkiae]|nr:sigma-54 dependent transcriptional regulator [Candidatus Electryonea clarkiae]MDP8289192.1 sigma-54 dependent transcriptional regulator [Candidatus Electryonea clarkiae]